MVMDIWRKWKVYKDKEKLSSDPRANTAWYAAVRTNKFFTAVKMSIDSERAQSSAKMISDIVCHISMICWKINQDTA